MSGRQRVVLVVALGAFCIVAASTLTRLLASADGGWFAYDPSTSVVRTESDGAVIRDALIWVAAIVVWVVPSFRLLRRDDDRAD